jgi:hypothetical protein
MLKTFGKYSFGLIALYLGVANYTGAGRLIESGANGVSTVTKTFQGR